MAIIPRQLLEYYNANKDKSRTERDFEKYELVRLRKQVRMLKQLKIAVTENEKNELINKELADEVNRLKT